MERLVSLGVGFIGFSYRNFLLKIVLVLSFYVSKLEIFICNIKIRKLI